MIIVEDVFCEGDDDEGDDDEGDGDEDGVMEC